MESKDNGVKILVQAVAEKGRHTSWRKILAGTVLSLACFGGDVRSGATERPVPDPTSGTALTVGPQTQIADPLSVPARDWALATATNEIEILLHKGSNLRYRQHSIGAKGDEVREILETEDGTVGRLILRDNRPLTDEEDRAERDRLNGLLDHPADFARHEKNDANGKKIAIALIKLMPDAMIYSYVAGQPQTPGAPGREVVLDYVPNPNFSPPTLASEGLTGLRGRIWIDAKDKEIVRMEGEIFHPINWGWGMLARIYPGGKVDLEQMEVNRGRWNMTQFHERVTARVIVKTMDIHAEASDSEFLPLPETIRYQDAIRILLNTPLPE